MRATSAEVREMKILSKKTQAIAKEGALRKTTAQRLKDSGVKYRRLPEAAQDGILILNKNAEDAQQKTENAYLLLAENMSDTVWMMDMNLNITWMSPSSVKARGMSLD